MATKKDSTRGKRANKGQEQKRQPDDAVLIERLAALAQTDEASGDIAEAVVAIQGELQINTTHPDLIRPTLAVCLREARRAGASELVSELERIAAGEQGPRRDAPLAFVFPNHAAGEHEKLGHKPVTITFTMYGCAALPPTEVNNWKRDGEVFARLLADPRCEEQARRVIWNVLTDLVLGPFYGRVDDDILAALYLAARVKLDMNDPAGTEGAASALRIVRETLCADFIHEITETVISKGGAR